jgi:hypothetical protein
MKIKYIIYEITTALNVVLINLLFCFNLKKITSKSICTWISGETNTLTETKRPKIYPNIS